jgi:hypothetical protein
MARQFPQIVAFTSAFTFALEAERACGDLAAAAGVLAPDDAWQAKLEELVCTHDDRVEKLTDRRRNVDQPVRSLDGRNYLSTLGSEPVTSWPAAVEQLIVAEEDAARYHDDFARECEEALGDNARIFRKSAQQGRAAAAELRAMLDGQAGPAT